jgi:hypothetical protein
VYRYATFISEVADAGDGTNDAGEPLFRVMRVMLPPKLAAAAAAAAEEGAPDASGGGGGGGGRPRRGGGGGRRPLPPRWGAVQVESSWTHSLKPPGGFQPLIL